MLTRLSCGHLLCALLCDRLWQQHHAEYLPIVECISDIIRMIPETIGSIDEECVSLTLWESFCGVEGPAPFKQVVQELLKLYVYTTVCDPPMIYDPQGRGEKVHVRPRVYGPSR